MIGILSVYFIAVNLSFDPNNSGISFYDIFMVFVSILKSIFSETIFSMFLAEGYFSGCQKVLVNYVIVNIASNFVGIILGAYLFAKCIDALRGQN